MTIKPREEIVPIMPYALGDSVEEVRRQYGIDNVRRMSENENVYGFSPLVKEALAQEAASLHRYPNGMAIELVQRLSSFYRVEENQILVANGSEEIIRLIVRAYLNHSEEAIMADLTFPRYRTNVLIEGGKAVTVPLREGRHHLEAMIDAVNERTKVIFVCNPNNPTGTIIRKKELFQFLSAIPSHVLVILDEAYFEYVQCDDYPDSISLLQQMKNLVILRTFSKIYGLAGLRIGYGIMNSEINNNLHKVREVFNVNCMAQAAASAALADKEFVLEVTKKNAVERKFLKGAFEQLGMECYDSETNFLFVKANPNEIMRLKENGVLVRPFAMKSGGTLDSFRITIGTREDNEYAIAVLQSLQERVV
ncbi:histidinol-phosphate transaminase [Bacillus massilinigeriensis]|uniref:histidinol-phosphate transaminase n=1 Tax=Bacillus mediterraneensis TaxID=1805474 RepID=UPI0008F7F124|nr:histidinol-phosphate transaminase [Bacillus mediterraneensis]